MSNHSTFINKIIKSKNKIVKWNNPDIIRLISPATEHYQYITNADGNHGYFWYLHKLTEHVEGTVVELGNRRGCSTLAIYDALKEGQKFYSFDIINDCRYVTPEVKKDPRVTINNNFDSLDREKIDSTFEKRSVSMLFCDTIHTYEQIKAEYDVWEEYLTDDAIIVVDDIQDQTASSDKRSKWKFHEEWDGVKFDVTKDAHNPTGFGIYLK
jgi:hypothetical protein